MTAKTPYEKALAAFRAHPEAMTFDDALVWHFLNGFVFARPDLFLLGRPVISKADHALIGDPSHRFESADCDCWFVYLFSGSLIRLYEVMPWPLPLISFARRGEKELLFFPLDRIREKSLGVSSS